MITPYAAFESWTRISAVNTVACSAAVFGASSGGFGAAGFGTRLAPSSTACRDGRYWSGRIRGLLLN